MQDKKLGDLNQMGEYVKNWPKTGVDPNTFLCRESFIYIKAVFKMSTTTKTTGETCIIFSSPFTLLFHNIVVVAIFYVTYLLSFWFLSFCISAPWNDQIRLQYTSIYLLYTSIESSRNTELYSFRIGEQEILLTFRIKYKVK